MVPVVSIEGFPADTDGRRRPGAHEAAVLAMGRLRDAGAFFGFAATNSAENTRSVGSDEFVDQMVELGCAVGFFIEYVPCGPNPEWSWVLDEGARAAFRARVLELRRTKPLLLSQFPHDEYGESNRCSAAGETSLHIGPEGDVEPCPFVAVGRDNVREGGLRAACESEFLRAVRESPVLLCRERLGCALFEHRDELMAVRESLGACSTGGTRGSRG